MPYVIRTHFDMLHLCCGICGHKKNPNQLRSISESILVQIKSIDGYQDYNLNDDRYPKVICEQHRAAVREKFKNPSQSVYKFKLPSNIPQFSSISLLSTVTPTTQSGFNKAHACFLCDQNHVGKSTKQEVNNNKPSKVCPKCLQITGRGIVHPCLKSTKKKL